METEYTYEYGKLRSIHYYNGESIHKIDYKYHDNGNLAWEHHHLEDGSIYGEFNNARLHRLAGPAVVKYFENNNGAIEWEYYYKDGRRHREDGPGHIRYNEQGIVMQELYYINGTPITDPFQILVINSLSK
jgi:antitoxin component YwqK of YwqJK toxin-antitoxin module